MSALSDQLLVAAILLYLVAMLCHAAEYAFGTRGAVARVLVGAGAPAVPVVETPRPEAKIPEYAARGALAAFGFAVLAHLGVAVTRGLAADRMPWGNMYEFTLSVTLVAALAWAGIVVRRPGLRHLGLYVCLALVLLLGVTGMVLYTEVNPLVPALNSYWFVVHVTAAVLASGIFLVGAVCGALYLLRLRHDEGKNQVGARLPKAETLEPLTFRLHAFAFPIWTFAVAAGAIWAERAWGRYWGWDPKETWAFISWVVYAGYLHARATPSVRRTTAIWIALIGWLTMLMNLFGVNIFFTGLHSYAGV